MKQLYSSIKTQKTNSGKFCAAEEKHTAQVYALPGVSRKGEGCRAMPGLTRSQHCRRKGRMVRRIREVLGLQAKGCILLKPLLCFSGLRPIQMVSAIKLHARLRRCHCHYTATNRIVNLSRSLHHTVLATQNPVQVVTQTIFQ